MTGYDDTGGAPVRAVICISHPIAYFSAQHAEVSDDPRIDLTVLYSVRTGAVPYRDVEFDTVVDPGLEPLLARIDHRFLSETADLEQERGLPMRRVFSELDALAPDVVVIYGFQRRISHATMMWARRRRRPLAYISDSEDRGVRSTRRTITAIKRVAAAGVLRGADRILSVGDANEAFYRRRWVPEERLVRVPFPIDRAAFAGDGPGTADEAAVAALRAQHGLGDAKVVLSSGKLVPRKRQADLVAALARSSHRDSTVLVLLGDGEDRARLEADAARLGARVLITGFTKPELLPPWYRLADVYAHVSDFDPHPLAISEAVHSGLPVIVSDRVGSWGPTDDVVPGVNGLVVPTGDVHALAAALDRLLGDDGERAAMAAASAARGQGLQAAAYRGFADALVDLAHAGRRR